MSRKRTNLSPETPPPKRHLNAALAREMEALRISRGAPQSPLTTPALSPRNVFGGSYTNSPFLTPSRSSTWVSHLNEGSSTASPIFGDLSHALPPDGVQRDRTVVGNETDEQPVITSPQSSASSMALDHSANEDDDNDNDDDNYNIGDNENRRLNGSYSNDIFANRFRRSSLPTDAVVITNASDDAQVDVAHDGDVTVEETPDNYYSPSSYTRPSPYMSQQASLPPPESRMVVYKPPVRSSSTAIAALNAVLPDGHYALRNGQSKDWYIIPPVEASKRKLAVVPWTPPQMKRLRELAQRPDTVIPMPWTGSRGSQPPIQYDQAMEIEEIS